MTGPRKARRGVWAVPPSDPTLDADEEYENWAITVPLEPSYAPSNDASTPQPEAREPPPEPPSVLTVDELAALLRVNRKTVYDALARNEIPGARRIGASYRILRDAVLEWLASGQDRVARSRRNR
jgi:excisionase family DNA binding protein